MNVTVFPSIPKNSISFDTQHTVTLSLQDWLGIQTQLGFAAFNNAERGEYATAEITQELLDRLRVQTMPAIEAAAEDER